jgi:hypothetical protein
MTARGWWQLRRPVEALTVLLLGITALTLGVMLNIGWLFAIAGGFLGSGLGASIRVCLGWRASRRRAEVPVRR